MLRWRYLHNYKDAARITLQQAQNDYLHYRRIAGDITMCQVLSNQQMNVLI